jgi:hypothetical protein
MTLGRGRPGCYAVLRSDWDRTFQIGLGWLDRRLVRLKGRAAPDGVSAEMTRSDARMAHSTAHRQQPPPNGARSMGCFAHVRRALAENSIARPPLNIPQAGTRSESAMLTLSAHAPREPEPGVARLARRPVS